MTAPHVQLSDVGKADDRGSVATRVIRSNRNQVLQSTLVILFAVAASSASTACIIYTRPTHVSDGALVDTSEKPVATAKAQEVVNLPDLPLLGMEFDYHSVEKVTLTVFDFETNQSKIIGLRTVGFSWINDTDMDLFLAENNTLHISQTGMILAPTVKDITGSTPVALRRRRLDIEPIHLLVGGAALTAGSAAASLAIAGSVVLVGICFLGVALAVAGTVWLFASTRRRKLLDMGHPLMTEARMTQAAALAASYAVHHASRDLLPNFLPPGSLGLTSPMIR